MSDSLLDFSGLEKRAKKIASALKLILDPGQVTELRALEATRRGEHRATTISGYFNDPARLAAEISEIHGAKGIYYVPNEVNPALLARAANRARPVHQEPTTSDRDIVRRRWLLLDLDPARPAGISSSDAEHAAALELANTIAASLAEESWPRPIAIDSGNGAHLMYRIDQPADDGGLVMRCLRALALRFDTAEVNVDQTVFNAARIWKLPGTWATKGDNTPERPHRLARVLRWPEELAIVSGGLLEALARQAPAEELLRSRPNRVPAHFDLPLWIVEHDLDVVGPTPWQGGKKWIFRVCPWNEAHTNGSAFVLQFASGAIAAGCHHSGCADNDWCALRDLVEPGWRGRRRGFDFEMPGVPPAIRHIYRRLAKKTRRQYR